MCRHEPESLPTSMGAPEGPLGMSRESKHERSFVSGSVGDWRSFFGWAGDGTIQIDATAQGRKA